MCLGVGARRSIAHQKTSPSQVPSRLTSMRQTFSQRASSTAGKKHQAMHARAWRMASLHRRHVHKERAQQFFSSAAFSKDARPFAPPTAAKKRHSGRYFLPRASEACNRHRAPPQETPHCCLHSSPRFLILHLVDRRTVAGHLLKSTQIRPNVLGHPGL